MSEQHEHEHADDEPAEPVTTETVIDADEEQAEAEEHEPEPEPEPAEPVQAKSDRDIEKAYRQLEKENTRHKNAVSKIMGEDANALVPCPRCAGFADGLVFPFEVAPLDDAVREAVLASIGMGQDAAPPLREAEGVETCPRCDGWGRLKYPTRNEHVKEQICPRCTGQGYVSIEQPAQNVPTTFPSWQPETSNAPNWSTNGALDQWGRPAGHPHYGQNPASVLS